jgi:hypothetical protein
MYVHEMNLRFKKIFVKKDLLSLAGDRGKWQYITFFFTWIEGIIIGEQES